MDVFSAEVIGEILGIVVVGIIVAVFFLLNLQQTLEAIPEHNRKITPGRVWLLLIPLFSIGYAFYLFPKISESLRLEFEARENPQIGDYGLGLGRAYAILGVFGILRDALGIIGSLTTLAGFVIMIILWVKMAQFKKTLISGKRSDGMSDNPDILD